MHLSLILVTAVYCLSSGYARDPDAGLDMTQIVPARGYPLEHHYPVTSDGYILGLFRIPVSPFPAPNSTPKGPILLMHALLDSSYAYVCQARNLSLAYLLADQGYDVWMGNVRGNTWSRNHTTLDPDSDQEFWDFSIDDHAKYDIPTLVNYILDLTGASKIPYIGHSQGTTIGFTAFSSQPELASKITLFIGFGPVWNAKETPSPFFRTMAAIGTPKLTAALGYSEFLASTPLLRQIGETVCSLAATACNYFLELVCGTAHNIDVSHIDAYVSQTPAGTSTKNMIQWSQGAGAAYFDYGCSVFSCKNKDIYGTSKPPSYNVKDFKIPTALFYGETDKLASVKEVESLAKLLPNVVFAREIASYAHLDFLWGMNAYEILYPDVFNLLSEYQQAPEEVYIA